MRLSPPPSHGEAWVHVPVWPGWGGWFCLLYKAHLCAQRGRGAAAPWRDSGSNCQTQPPPSPGSPDLGRLLSLKRTLTLGRETRAGGEMGETSETIITTVKKKKKADFREREGRELRDHVI